MYTNKHNDELSIAIDRALLKLTKEHGYAIQKDDPLLIQLFQNKEIMQAIFKDTFEVLKEENEKSKLYFRESLVELTKKHNENLIKCRNIVLTSTIGAIIILLLVTVMALLK